MKEEKTVDIFYFSFIGALKTFSNPFLTRELNLLKMNSQYFEQSGADRIKNFLSFPTIAEQVLG